jgi:hypothetical protein
MRIRLYGSNGGINRRMHVSNIKTSHLCGAFNQPLGEAYKGGARIWNQEILKNSVSIALS